MNKNSRTVPETLFPSRKEAKEERRNGSTSTRLLPLWVASPSSSEPQQQPPPWPPQQQTQQQQTTSSQPSTSTKSSQNANPPWDRTTSTPSGQHHPSKSVNLGGGNQIVHNSGFSLVDEEGNNHLVQRLSSRLTTHRAKVEEPNFSINRRMSRGRTFFQYSDVRRTLVGSRNLVRWRIREGIMLASADGDTREFFQWDFRGYEWVLWTFFSVGRECCLYGFLGRYLGLLS